MIVYDNLSVGNAKKKKKDNAVESFKSGLYAGFNAAMNQQAGKASGSKLGEAYANIYKMKEKDPDRASKMSGVLSYLRSDPTSEYYNAYSQPTSNAFNQLKALGFDTNLINDDFFGSQDYQSFMAQNLERSDTTGGVKAPSKKSTIQNQLAYYLDKTYGDYQTTKKAKEEYNSMMDTAMYLAGNPAWNYSDQKILDEINKDFDKNYPTLSKMRNSGNTPIGLTEAMDFSEDAMLGAIWAGRNPEYSGTLEGAMANSYLGKGNVWKEDPKISAMLNPEDPSFLPYATGSTNLLKEGQILKRYYYPEEYFDSQEFKDAYYGDDPVKKAAAEKVLNAEGNQKAADKAVPAIIGYANYLLTNDHDANSVRGKIDTALAAGKLYVSTDANGNQKFYTKPGKGREEIDLGILNKIDKTVGKTDADGKRSFPVNDPEELLSFTRGVNYKYDNLIGQVNDICDQYSKQSSGDTYANLNPDNQGVAREKKPFELIEEAKRKRAADAMYILDDKLSEMERKNFGALPMPNGTKLAEAFYNVKRGLWGNGDEITGPYDTEKLTNPEWVAKMATRQAEKAEKNFLDTGLSSLQVRTQYEANKKEADKLQAQLDEIENQYGDIILAKQDIPELLNVVIDEDTGFSVNLRLEKDKDGNSVYKYHQKDNEDFSLSLPAQEYMNRNNLTEQDVYAAINERAKRSDDNIKLVQDAKKRVFGAKQELTLDDGDGNELDIPFYYNEESGSFDLSPDFNSRDQSVFDFLNNSGYTENELWVEINEYINQLNAELEGPNEEEVNRVTARLDQLKGQLSATQDEYDKAVKDYDRANSRRARVNDLTLRNSGLYVDPAITDKILSFVGGFTDSKLPEAGYDSLVDDLQSVFGLRELTDEESKSYKENVDELNAHAKDIRFMIDNYNLSDFYKEKMTKEAEYYESRGRLYNAYLITKEDDYESLIKEALDENNELSYDGIAKPYRSGINKTAWGQMTSTERGVYYALSVKEGLEAATQFYQDIEANLIARARTNIREGVKETAESGFLGRVFNEAASIGSALFEVPLNVAYLIDSAINGEGSKWWRIPSEAAQEAHQAVINELNTIYDGTIWKDIFTGGAEILNNRGRSYAIGGVFGKFMPHIPGEGKMIDAANDIISSFPIATIAFGEAYEDAMENDMEPWQAWTLGTVNFLCESVTEGIKFGNYESLMDGNLTLDTFVDYFADKIAGLDWLEEATGETLNNILERAFNKWVGGDKSEEQKKIQEYIDSGLVSSVDEARAMVMADYVKEDMHTAIISALSSFLDVGMFGAAKLMDTAHYAKELAEARRNGDTTSTIRSLRNQDIQQVKMIRDFQEQAEKIRQSRIEEANKPFVPANPANVSESQMQRNQTEYDVDQTILENAADSDQESVTGTIAAVLRISDQNVNRANAAAVSFTDRFGEDAVSALQSMLEAGRKAGTNINTLKLGIQYSMLAEGECRQVMESEAYQNASPEEQAQMLSVATQADANNQAVQATVQEAVHDNRVAEAEKDLFGENEAFELNALHENADEAARKTYIAQEEMNDRMEARKAAADNVTSVTMDFLADPSDANKKRKDQAERELAAADAVSKEYEQAFNKARDTQTKAENALEQTKDDVMTRIRQQAEEQVSQLEQQEAEQAQAAAEQQRIAAEQAAEAERQQIIADSRSGKTAEESARAKIQRLAEAKGYTGEQAEQFVNDVMNFWQTGQVNKIDLSKQFGKSDGYLMMGALSRRFGVNVDITDIATGENGYYDPSTNTITLNKNLPAGQVLVEFALHELTHSLENTGAYQQYHDTVLNVLFPSEAELNDAIAKKITEYEDAGRPLVTDENGTADEKAKREIVAEFTRLKLNDKAMVQRMVDAGMGGRIRNALHNVNQFFKNIRLTGEARTEAENLRRTERLFQRAIRDRSRAQAKARTEAIKQANTPAAKLERSATPVVSNTQGDAEVSEVRGGTISRTDGDTEYSVASWTDEEKQRVRNQLKDRMMSENDGSMTEEEMDAKIDKWINDVNDIAYIITNDRNRLDYKADPEKTMLKPNAEYVKTLDASTLCAKRLLYQGTFDAIQHQLPNTPLMPEDLIDLANMMREMGYEAPCGICYVESRRRQLGKFTEQWLESYEGEYKPTLDEVTTSDGLEKLRSTHPQAYQDFISAMNKKGTMNPKVVQLRTDYRGEISQMTPAQVQKVIDIGGLRVQSFSDFETPHLIDMMQAVMDMSSQKLTAQAYTKVPNFPWVFGDTGIKINLSLIGKGTGLDENGNLLFDDVEGMPFEEAMKLRDRYSNNVGTILVGINDQHILAAMADDRIDFIIPFHKSGWSKEELTKMPVLNGYSDYTDSQNEKVIVGRDKNGKYKTESLDKSKRVNFQPVGENGYWDFSKSGKENAETYLKMCAEDGRLPKFSQFLVDNGDGSFSLQPDGSTDGYWKTLIDFKMYDNEGNGAPQQEVNPNFNMDEARRVLDEYSLDRNGVSRESNNDLPVAQEVVDAYVQKYKDEHPGREYSAGMGELTDAQMAQALQQANVDYQDAVARGDMEAAQEDVDFYAEQKGYTTKAYHGTSRQFTVFDKSKSGQNWNGDSRYGPGFYFAYDRDTALKWTDGVRVVESYLKMENPLDLRNAAPDNLADVIRDYYANDKKYDPSFPISYEQYQANLKRLEEMDINNPAYFLSHLKYDSEGKMTDGIFELLSSLGFDSIVTDDEMVVFDPSQIKSADPVTYDDNGNVIPLDQRFSDSPDIRYSTGFGEMTDAQRLEALQKAMPEYMKSFAEQLHDFAPKETRKDIFGDDALLVGPTPELYKNIGFPSLPMLIDQEHVGYALDGSYPKEKYRAGHIFEEEEFAKLPEKIASPVAITYDPRSTKQFTIYIDMVNTEGNSVIVPLRVGGGKDIGGETIQANVLLTVFEDEDGEQMLMSAIQNDSDDNHSLLYLDNEKALKLATTPDNITIVRDAPSGINHIINGPNSKVNTSVKTQTDTTQFRRWFNGSKITNPDGTPKIVYHGTSEQFTAFDMSKGRSTMDIQGAFFSPYEIEAGGYGENVGQYYLSIKNPAPEHIAYKALNMFKGQNDAGAKAKAYLESKGYDGVVYGVGEDAEEYIAFHPEQIKSATDNVGMFNGNNPDFRYATGEHEMTDAELSQVLIDAGLMTQEELMAQENLPGYLAEGGEAQRQFGYETAQESNALHDEVKQYLYTHSNYMPDTNQGQVNRAIGWVQSKATESDPDGYYAALDEIASETFDYRSADGQARMLTVMSMAALKAENGKTAEERRNALNDELRIADAYNKQGTDLGRALQARKIFRLMTPLGRVAALQSMADRINEDYGKKGIKNRVGLSEWTLKAASEAQTEEDFQKVQDAAAKEIAEQMPVSWKERLNAMRMLSMLGNPRTHIRNIIGNALFVPAVSLKNKLGAMMELGMDKGDRTKTLALAVSKEIRDFARQDAITMKDTLTGTAKYNEDSKVQMERKIFGTGDGILSKTVGNFIQTLSDFNSNALEGEDWFFLKGHYRRALGGWIQANGYTIDEIQSNPDLLEKGRQYAIEEAQKATYRDFNEMAKRLNDATRDAKTIWGKSLAFGVNAVLPFKKTPANILRRGLEYSPLGIAKSLTADAFHLHQYNEYQKGNLEVLPENAISPNQFIDKLCSGLTGSAILAVGFLLAGSGAVTCGLDDDDDEFEKLKGGQEYSVNLGKLGNMVTEGLFKAKLFGEDVTFTMDWAAPMSMPFFVGAALREQVDGEGVTDIDGVLNAIFSIGEPLTNLSMLDGLNSVFRTSQNSDAITQVGAKIVSNYLTSFIPSAVGAVARSFDPIRRKSFVESGKGSGPAGIFRSSIEQSKNKIPGMSMNSIPVRDAFGNVEETGTVERILENFVLPGYLNSYKNDPVIDELERLYGIVDESKKSGMVPKMPQKTIGNGKVVLSAEQYDQLTEERGKTAHALIEQLMSNRYYQQVSDDDKATMINDVWTYATQNANYSISKDSKVDTWVLNSRANPIQGIVNRQKARVDTEYKEGYKAAAVESVKNQKWDDLDVCIEKLEEAGVKDPEGSIKTAVGNAFKAQYIRAYQEGDSITMDEIETLLIDSGLGFDSVNKKGQSTFDIWIENMNDQVLSEEEEE